MKTEKIKQNIVKSSEYLSKNGKTLLIGASVAVGLLVMWKIYRSFTRKSKTEEEREKEQQVQGVIEQSINKQNLTITEQQAKNFAQQLLDAMDYAAPVYGTDEDTIASVLKKIKTKDDFLLIFKAFGLKEYNGNGLPPTGWARHIDNYEPRNLVYWLKAELSPRDGEAYTLAKKFSEMAGFAF